MTNSRPHWFQSRRRFFASACILVLAVSVAIPWYLNEQEQAVARLLDAVQNGFRSDVDRSLAHARKWGAADEAIPQLIEVLKGSRTGVQPQHHINAERALAQIGPMAVPSLLTAMAKDDYRIGANGALRMMGDAAVPEVTFALEHSPRSEVRAAAADALYNLAANGMDVSLSVPALTRALQNDQDSNVRTYATFALAEMPTASTSAMPALIEALDDSNKFVRLGAADAIADIDPGQAAVALPLLVQLLSDSEPSVRYNAAISIGKFGPHAESATASLLNALDDAEAVVRAMVVSALGSVGKPPETIVPALIREIERERSNRYRWRAVNALGRFGPTAKAAVPTLTVLLENEGLRASALEALKQVQPDANPN